MEVTKERNGTVTDSKGTRPLYDLTINDVAFVQAIEEDEANAIINEHATLKANKVLLDSLISYATNDHNALNNSMWERQVLTKLKEVISKYKELK